MRTSVGTYKFGLLFAAGALIAGGQTVPRQIAGDQKPAAAAVRPTYVLGPNDELRIGAADLEEIDGKQFRVRPDGTLRLPLDIQIDAAGMTVEAFEATLVQRLKMYHNNPQVLVSVVQFRSDPVFVMGSVKSPGLYNLQGRRTLVEMLAAMGGLQPNASRVVKITRRQDQGMIPLPGILIDPETKTSSVEITLNELMQAVNPAEDIVLEPYDVISVGRAEMVYVSGEFAKPGGFELENRESLSITQVVSMAGGVTKTGDATKALVLRPGLDTSRRATIPINIKEILAGRDEDFALLPNDVLVVPQDNSSGRNFRKAMTIIAPTVATSAIFLLFRR